MTGKRDERLLLASAGLAGLAALFTLTLATRDISVLPAAAVPFNVVALLLALLVWLRLRLRRLSEDERREEELAKREGRDSRLFDDAEFQPFTAARGQAQFERFFVPAFAPLLAIVQGVWAWHLFRSYAPAEGGAYLWVASILAGQAFLLFLLSRYLLGLSKLATSTLLRGPGVVLGVASLASVLAAAGTVVSHTLYPPAERILYWVLTGYLGILAVECVLNFIGECYRPRSAKGKVNRAYESRISGLFTDPASWVNSVAQALDYQFGFNVSDTWFYRFLQGALLPLVLFQLTVLYLLSSLVFIQPYELGIRERFGKPRVDQGVLESGMHLKWPWPFETVRRFPAKRVQSFHIGLTMEEEEDPTYGEDGRAGVGDHHDEVVDLGAGTPRRTGRVPGGQRGHRGPGPGDGAGQLPQRRYPGGIPDQRRLQVRLRACRPGGPAPAGGPAHLLPGSGPARPVRHHGHEEERDRREPAAEHPGTGRRPGPGGGDHFRRPPGRPSAGGCRAGLRVGHRRHRGEGSAILNAQAEAGRRLPLARAEAAAEVLKAEAFKVRREAESGAETDRFVQLREAYDTAPSVFRTRRYLRALRDSLEGSRKYIVSTSPDTEVIQFNFEEKIGADGLDFGSVSLEGSRP